ncbi:MAG: O-antigen ligase family protein, partial [Pontibacterium sp.]
MDLSPPSIKNAFANWPILLTVLAVALQPFSRSVELVVLIMAVIGTVDLIKNRNNLRTQQAFKWFSILFACFWLPALLSLPDAVNLSKSTSTTLGMLRFYLAGVFVISRITASESLHKVAFWMMLIAVAWGLNAVFQLIVGVDILGQPPHPGRITSFFGEKPKLGWMILAIAPLAGFYLWKTNRKALAIAAALLMLFTIFISGVRGAWLGVFWSCAFLFFAIIFFYARPKVWQLGAMAVALVITIGAATQMPILSDRISQSSKFLSTDYNTLNEASGGRLTIWATSMRMIEDNWLNGNGARSYRYAYPDYAAKNDTFNNGDTGAYHAHQIVIEIAADTGLIGFVGYLIALGMLAKMSALAIRKRALLSLGLVSSSIGVLMPIGSHLSTYSSSWSQAMWALLALTIAMLFYEDKK